MRADMPRLRLLSVMSTLAALFAVAGVAATIAVAYGEYYLHVANGHTHNHPQIHLLSAAGALALLTAARLVVVSLIRERRGL